MEKVLLVVSADRLTEDGFKRLTDRTEKSGAQVKVLPIEPSLVGVITFGECRMYIDAAREFSCDRIAVYGSSRVVGIAKAISLTRFYAGTLDEIFRKKLDVYRCLPYQVVLTEGADGTECLASLTVADLDRHYARTLKRDDLAPEKVTVDLSGSAKDDAVQAGLASLYTRLYENHVALPEGAYRGAVTGLLSGLCSASDKAAYAAEASAVLGKIGSCVRLSGAVDYLSDIVCAKLPTANKAAADLWAGRALFENFGKDFRLPFEGLEDLEMDQETENMLRDKALKARAGLYFRN